MDFYRTPTDKTKGVMIDLETFGQGADCVIASVAAVIFPFDVEEPLTWLVDTIDKKDYFSKVVNINQPGRSMDAETVKWWMGQEDRARQVLLGDDALPLGAVLQALFEWYPRGVPAFSKGSNFDLTILEHAYKQIGLSTPWEYYQALCARTLFEISGVGKPHIDVLIGHTALDDALLQAVWAQRAYKALLIPSTEVK